MKDDDTIVFVEVRYRSTLSHGGGVISVDRKKQRRVARAALSYLQARNVPGDVACRFDVVALNGYDNSFEWIADAFEAQDWN